MSLVELKKTGQGGFAVIGEIGFSTASRLLAISTQLFDAGADITIDLSGVTRADSAGLAILLEWLDIAKQKNMTVNYRAIPEQILAIARTSGIDEIFAAH